MTFYDESYYSKWTCETAIERGKEYPAADLKCVDESGKDPISMYSTLASEVESIDFTFTENYLMHDTHPFYRTSYKGCSVTPQLGGLVILILVAFIALVTTGLFCIAKAARKSHSTRKDLAQNSLLNA
ncbi:hypothetical protein WA556_002211 [Blastocystis sp. ATCC 50177/Nand II]